MSSGAAMNGAIELADQLDEGAIVVLFRDRGEKYLSTPLLDLPANAKDPSEENGILPVSVAVEKSESTDADATNTDR